MNNEKFNITDSYSSEEVNQSLLDAKKVIENYYHLQLHKIDLDEQQHSERGKIDLKNNEDESLYKAGKFNPRSVWQLMEFFGLLTEQDYLKKFRNEEHQGYGMKDVFVDFETLVVVEEEYPEPYGYQEGEIYYGDNKILITYGYEYCAAFKIGETIDQCLHIGTSMTWSNIYKAINLHLAT